MGLGVSQEPRTFMDILPERRHSLAIRVEVDMDATRLDEKGVVDVVCDEP